MGSNKQCYTCAEVKPLSDFHRHRKHIDGRSGICKECACKRSREWHEANLERSRANALKQARADPAANVAKVKRWRKANPERYRLQTREQMRRRRLERDPTANAYAEILRFDPCAYCGGAAGQIDHIEPLALGGSNQWPNLTAACSSCNPRKNAKPLLVALLS